MNGAEKPVRVSDTNHGAIDAVQMSFSNLL